MVTPSAPKQLADLDATHIERRAARGGLVLGVAQVLKGAIDAVGSLFLARTLLPADFGLVDMIVAITGIVDLLKDAGLSTATIQKRDIDHAQVSALFWINLAAGCVLMLLTLGLAPLLALGYGKPELLGLTAALSVSTLLGAASVQHLALLRRDLRFTTLGVIDVVSAVGATAAALLAASRGLGPWALVVRQLVRLATQAVFALTLSSFRPGRPRRTDVRDLLGFGAHLSGFQVVNYLERNLDNVLVGRVIGAQALGYYAKAYELMRLPLNQVSGPISTVALPALSRLLSSPERYVQTFEGLARFLMLVTVPLAPLSIVTAEWLLPALLGPQWQPCVPIFQWLGLTLLTKPLTHAAAWLFVTQARTRELFRFGMFAGVLAVASFVVGLRWGAVGVAASYTLVDLCVRSPVMFFWAGRTGPVSTRKLLGCAVPAWGLSAVMSAGYWLLLPHVAGLSRGARVAVLVPACLLLGALVLLATSMGRATLRDGARLFRSLRGGPSS